MKSMKGMFVLLAAVALLLTAYTEASSQEQQPSPSPAAQSQPAQPSQPSPSAGAQVGAAAGAQATLSAEGELVEVNQKDNKITIKTASNPKMEFKFDDATKVTGGQKGVAGLATMTGSQLTISYKRDGADMVATSIAVKPAAGAGATSRPAETPRPAPGVPSPGAPSPEKPAQPEGR